MKKSLFSLLLIFFVSMRISFGQTFDWNLRGGMNMMPAISSDKKVSFYYHVGAQAGLRIANYGIYGEVLYSMQENQHGGGPLAYFDPGIIAKGFWRKFLFVEVGGVFMVKAGDSGLADDSLNPNGRPYMVAGLGANFSKLQLSLRTIASQNYHLVQATLAVKF